MKTIILGNAPINNGNRGCVALTYCSIYLIDKILGHGNYKLYLTDSGEAPGMHSISMGDISISYESVLVPQLYKFKVLLKNLFKLNNVKRIIYLFKNADFVLDIGQGDSFADIYGKERYLWIDHVHRLARLVNKKYLLLPQTIGPFTDLAIRRKAIKSIGEAAFVMTRDRQSYDYVKEIAPNQKNLREYIDVAFFLPYKKKTFEEGSIHVGLNISALLWNGGYTRDNQFGLRCDYHRAIRETIEFFLSMPDVTLHLVPHVVLSERYVENDYEVSFDLFEEYHNNRLILAPFFLSPVDAKSYISGLDFFMGARMHATIAAFSSGVPVVPMAYSRKFNGLFIDTLHYDNLVDMKTMGDEDILDAVRVSFDDRQKLRSMIQDRMNGVVKEREKQLLDDLSRLLR